MARRHAEARSPTHFNSQCTSMRAHRAPPRRPGAAVAGAALLIIAFACGDPYLHTNPYDPVAPVTITIDGPDTIFSLGQLAQYTATEVPAFPDTALTWTIDTSTIPNGLAGWIA